MWMFRRGTSLMQDGLLGPSRLQDLIWEQQRAEDSDELRRAADLAGQDPAAAQEIWVRVVLSRHGLEVKESLRAVRVLRETVPSLSLADAVAVLRRVTR